MRRLAPAAVLSVAGALLLVLAAAAALLVVDQQQTTVDPRVAGFVIGGMSQQQIAQTVTTGVSGELQEVRLPISCTEGDLTAQVQTLLSGVPSGVVVSSRKVSGADLPPTSSSGVFRGITFLPPPFFATGERFAVVLQSSGLCEVQAGPEGDAYPRGEGLFRDRLAPAGDWVALGLRQDIPFQTVVRIGESGLPGFDEDADNFLLVRCFLGALLR